MPISSVAKSLIFNSDGKILLLTRSEHDEYRPGGYDFPGGGVEPGEDFKAAVSRELEEEAGIIIAAHEFELLYSRTEFDDGRSLSLNRQLFITKTTNDIVTLSPDHSAYKWCTIAEVLDLHNGDFYQKAINYALSHQLLR